MTDRPDGNDPEEPDRPAHKLDEDAAWRAIVENYGERPTLDEPPGEPPAEEPPKPVGPDPSLFRPAFRTRWEDQLDTEASWGDEGHFVPPDPPPLPPLHPRRKAAWIGTIGGPALMLVLGILGISLPGWLAIIVAVGFVAGFVYLVATMPRSRPGNGGGGDGAVI